MNEFQYRYTLTMPADLDYPWIERVLRLMLGGYERSTQRNEGDHIHLSFHVPLKAGDKKTLLKYGFGVEER
jgi:hypothetical protein